MFCGKGATALCYRGIHVCNTGQTNNANPRLFKVPITITKWPLNLLSTEENYEISISLMIGGYG